MDIIQEFNKIGCNVSNNGFQLYVIQKWLRESKDIHVEPGFRRSGGGVTKYAIAVNAIFLRHDVKQDFNVKLFSTYEEALEAGIMVAYQSIIDNPEDDN